MRIDTGDEKAGTRSEHLMATDLEQDRTVFGHEHITTLMQTQGTNGGADSYRRGNQQREGVQVSPMSAAAHNDGDRCA